MDKPDNLESYRTVLRHVVRPDSVSERDNAASVLLYGWEALYMLNPLREYINYYARDEENRKIAEAYREYINMVVRDERCTCVTLYAHTHEAWAVLLESLANDLENHVSDEIHSKFLTSYNDAIRNGLL